MLTVVVYDITFDLFFVARYVIPERAQPCRYVISERAQPCKYVISVEHDLVYKL